MDHAEAIESQASERYVLAMLSAAETDAFEEHYFDCAECAEDVRAATSFMEGGRRLVKEPAAPVVRIDSHPRHRGWKTWIPTAAAAALLLANGGVWMTRMQPAAATFSATAVSESDTFRSEQAGSKQTAKSFTTDTPILFNVVETSAQYTKFEARLIDAEGKVVETYPLTLEQASLDTALTIRKPGNYHLSILGIDSYGKPHEIDRRALSVNRRE